jgi:hypothetical protein
MFLVKVFIISVLSFLLTFLLPWYIPFVICFITGIALSNKPGNNFIAGLLGIGLFWLGYALFLDIKNEHLLSAKIAQLFSDSLGTPITSGVLLMVTTFLGALLGGLSCMSGAMLVDDGSRKRLRKAVKSRKYTLKMK